MTPLQYYNEYRHLHVDLVGGRKVYDIDIHEYRNARDHVQGTSEIAADHDVTIGVEAWEQLSRLIRRHGQRVRQGVYWLWLPLATDDNPNPNPQWLEEVETPRLYGVFLGKGSPELINQALRLAAAFGIVQPDTASMNAWCGDNIGLDCSGFVGNYLKREGHATIGASTPARAFVAPATSPNRFSRLDQLEAKAVLCWKSGGHCAIIHEVLPTAQNVVAQAILGAIGGAAAGAAAQRVTCSVCESTGASLVAGDVHTDGMNFTHYTFESVDAHKVFKVRRGIGGRGLNEVYVSRLLVP
jgi:hypothetical protein